MFLLSAPPPLACILPSRSTRRIVSDDTIQRCKVANRLGFGTGRQKLVLADSQTFAAYVYMCVRATLVEREIGGRRETASFFSRPYRYDSQLLIAVYLSPTGAVAEKSRSS